MVQNLKNSFLKKPSPMNATAIIVVTLNVHGAKVVTCADAAF